MESSYNSRCPGEVNKRGELSGRRFAASSLSLPLCHLNVFAIFSSFSCLVSFCFEGIECTGHIVDVPTLYKPLNALVMEIAKV